MKVIDYLRGWFAAAATYVLATLITAWVTSALPAFHLPEATTSWVPKSDLAPWLVPAVLSAVAAIVAVRRRARAEWWKWLILTVAVPFAGGAVIGSLALNHAVDAGELARSVVCHVVVAGVLGVSIGTVLTRVRASTSALRR